MHPNNINRDLGIEIKKHNNRRAVRQRTAEGANYWVNSKDRNSPSCWKTTNHSRGSCFITSRMTSRPHRLKKTSSMQSKRRNLHHTRLHRETSEKLSFYCYSPRWITTTFSTKSWMVYTQNKFQAKWVEIILAEPNRIYSYFEKRENAKWHLTNKVINLKLQ